jgi:hypothetical protein
MRAGIPRLIPRQDQRASHCGDARHANLRRAADMIQPSRATRSKGWGNRMANTLSGRPYAKQCPYQQPYSHQQGQYIAQQRP